MCLLLDVPFDLKSIDLQKQRVKTLKKILREEFADECKVGWMAFFSLVAVQRLNIMKIEPLSHLFAVASGMS